MAERIENAMEDDIQVIKEIPIVTISDSSDNEDVGLQMEVVVEKNEEEVCATPVVIPEEVCSEPIAGSSLSMVNSPKHDQTSKSAKTKAEIDELLAQIKLLKRRNCSSENFQKLVKKMTRVYDKIKHLPSPIQVKIQEKVRKTTERIATSQKFWGIMHSLVMQISPTAAPLLLKESDEAPKELKKQQIQYYTAKYLKTLEGIAQKIKHLGTEAVDLDDEENSVYIIQERLKEKYMLLFYKLCEITGHSKSVNRPVHDSFSLQDIKAGTGSSSLDKEIEDFLNSLDHLTIPDFADLFEIVNEKNKDNQLNLGSNHEITMKMLDCVVTEIKRRRHGDFTFQILNSIPAPSALNVNENDISETVQDPASLDPELFARLEANKAMGSSEGKVIEEFMRRQMEEKGVSATIGATSTDDGHASSSDGDEKAENEDELDVVFESSSDDEK